MCVSCCEYECYGVYKELSRGVRAAGNYLLLGARAAEVRGWFITTAGKDNVKNFSMTNYKIG